MHKGTSVKILILMASILVLAHAVIPHLHFNNEVYIITSECESDPEHKENAPEHNHDAEKDGDLCILNQVVLIPPDDAKANFDSPAIQHNIDFDGSLNAILASLFFVHSVRSLPRPPTLNLLFNYTQLVDSSVNMRGSPLV